MGFTPLMVGPKKERRAQNAQFAALHQALVLSAVADTAALALVALALCTLTYCWSYQSLLKSFGVQDKSLHPAHTIEDHSSVHS